MFVTIGTFSEAAQDYLNRRGIIATDGEELVLLEKNLKSIDAMMAGEVRPQDKLILQLRDQVKQLRRELERRTEIADLSSQLEDLSLKIDMGTLPAFLHPASSSTHIWYSGIQATPFTGLPGRFNDFLMIFPLVEMIVFTTRGFLGERQKRASTGRANVNRGGIHLMDAIREESAQSYDHQAMGNYLLRSYLNRAVFTLDKVKLGTVTDFCIGAPRGSLGVQAAKITLEENLAREVKERSVVIPAERLEIEGGYFTLLARSGPRGDLPSCRNCGAVVQVSASFCLQCGKPLK
jgi:hypothetical protein